ncbi:MAG: hypothetical protein AB8H12_17260 [Lewinella sp.]
MKRFLVILIPLLLYSCGSQDDAVVDFFPNSSNWQLEAQLFDPGDGSGLPNWGSRMISEPGTKYGYSGEGFEYLKVESERRIGFISGKVATNGSFCDLTGVVGPETEARFDEALDKIVVENCDASGEDMLLGLEVSEDQ